MFKNSLIMTTTPELQTKILEDFLHYFLPEGLLDYFEPVMAEDKEHQVKKDEVCKRDLHLYFNERDNRTHEIQHLRPNGFTEERTISDFPARNRKLALHIRRRRWLYSKERISYSTYASLPATAQSSLTSSQSS